MVAAPLGTAFTYQGQLKESGLPANGLYDLQFCLFDTSSNPMPLGCAAEASDVPVAAGLFSVALDFGSAVFSGQDRYLELSVRPAASADAYTTLAPRQLIRPTPEALRSNAAAAAPWSGLIGIPAGFADGVDDAGGNGGTVTSIASGTGLTGGPITTNGTLGIANGGVGAAQIAAGAVGSTQINTAQVQQRVAGACVLGTYLRGINTDGSVLCSELPGVNTITTVDNPANNVGENNSIAIGADGLPVISYYESSSATLKVAKCANTACTGNAMITTVGSGVASSTPTTIAIGADGLPVIAYKNFIANALSVAKCANAACGGSATITLVDDPVNGVGSYPSIAIGTDGFPVISYQDSTAGTLKVAKCANAACTGVATITTVADPTGNVGEHTSLAIGADGLPVISYLANTANALRVVKCAHPACIDSASLATITLNTVASNLVGGSGSISLAIGADGLPVIAYYDDTAVAIKVAKCANSACSGSAMITSVGAPASQVGFYISLDIGTDSWPVISYRDTFAGSLKVAKCADAACSSSAAITTLDDSANNVGRFTSLAIGADGLPVISYLDDTAAALRVVKCGSPSCR